MYATLAGLGLTPNSAPDPSYLLVQPQDAAIDGLVVESLPPIGETGLAPDSQLWSGSVSRLLWEFGE